MTAFKALLAWRPKPDTNAAALSASLAEAQAALATALSRAATLEGQRGDVLLDATPTEAEAHEARLGDAAAEAARLSAVVAALPARIAAAEMREREAALDTLAAGTEALAAEGAALLPGIVHALAAVAALMRRHDDLAAKVLAASTELRAGGREPVALPMRLAWPDAGNTTATMFGFDLLDHGARTVFRPAPGFDPGRTLANWVAAKIG